MIDVEGCEIYIDYLINCFLDEGSGEMQRRSKMDKLLQNQFSDLFLSLFYELLKVKRCEEDDNGGWSDGFWVYGGMLCVGEWWFVELHDVGLINKYGLCLRRCKGIVEHLNF